MQKKLFSDQETLKARALFLGKKINIDVLETGDRLATFPLTVTVGTGGCAVLFRYGAVVLVGLTSEEESTFLKELNPLVSGAFESPETEEVEIHLKPAKSERVQDSIVLLQEFTLERLQIVADLLSKSVVLAHYETSLAAIFDRIEPFADSLQQEQSHGREGRELLRQLGSALLVQHKIVGRVEMIDKPELLWEFPELDHLYQRLEDEYEIRERHHGLERKLELISRTSLTVLELMQHSSNLRVEWYIVILILVEIILSLYSIFIHGAWTKQLKIQNARIP